MTQNQISVKELKDFLKQKNEGSILIDVRTELEYHEERVGEARNLPLPELTSYVDDLKKYKNIYVMCRSGGRSQIGAMQLSALGLKNVYNVSGGILEWKRNGFETVRN